MATQTQLRRGTTTQHATFTGAVGETTVDTSKNTLVVHNGSTAGGFPLSLEAYVVENTNVAPALGTLSNKYWYRCTSASITTAPTMTFAEISATTNIFECWVTFTAPDTTAPVVTNNSTYTIKYHGDGVSGGTFTPSAASVYDLHFKFNGINLNCEVFGVA
jgi:hypothetical protein